jgi:hypothetical protein
MKVSQLKYMLKDVPENTEIYCSQGDPIPNYTWGAYKASYDKEKNIFYVQYLLRNK